MSGSDSEATRQAISIERWARWLTGAVGSAGLGAGGVATFTRSVEAGPVALIAVGALFYLVALSGRLPTRIKVGDSEAEWQEIAQSIERIDQAVPEVAALLDEGGASLHLLLGGESPAPGPDMARAGVKVGSLATEIRRIEARGAADRVPPEALLEVARWYLSQQDWSEGARYLSDYAHLSTSVDWETFFSLGVAYSNIRGGESTDRAALRAYDEAMARMPSGQPTPLTARLYSYRAAIKKRLGRLDEARADAEVAIQLAEKRYDLIDATYNLASIEALRGDRTAAMRHLHKLHRLGSIHLVLGHLDDYFASLADDPEFHRLLRPGGDCQGPTDE